MKIMFNGNEIGRIATNKSLTTEEALYLLGIDVNNQEDCQKAYDAGAEYAYIDDCGNYCIDTENIELDGER